LKVSVEVIFPDKKVEMVIEITDGLKGERFFKAITKAVDKEYGAKWERWNLLAFDA
jgi:hypothetical protein